MRTWIVFLLLCLGSVGLLLPSCTPTPGNETTKESTQEATTDASTEPKKEANPEPRPEPKSEPRPEPKPEPSPEPGAEPSPEPGPEPRPEPRTEPTPEPASDGGAEPVREPVPEVKPEPRPEVRPEVKPEPTPDKPPTSGVPTDTKGLFAFLKAGKFLSWKKESKVHPAIAIHSSQARVFINTALDKSLSAGNKSHPVGSASVKELYDSTGKTLRGWAVMVKVANAGNVNDWYWYETFNTTSAANPVASGRGISLCYGCHSSGKDYFRTKYPLQ